MQKSVFHQAQSKYNPFYLLYCMFSGLFLVLSTPLAAQGDLLIFPKRVVFDAGEKAKIINLTNIGKDSVTYSISFVQIRMNENGSFETITEPDNGQFFADPFIRFYPRTVTLAPKESQVVKLQLKKTSAMLPGEYRSHLYFRAEPKQKPLEEKDIPANTESIAVKLTPVYGITIPAIIQSGQSTSKVSLHNMAFSRDEESQPNLSLEFHRAGNMSVYGNILVNYISPEGEKTKVAQVTGFAVYAPGALRRSTIKLQEPAGVDYAKGKLVLTYSTPPEAKSLTMATAELLLAN